LVDIGNIAYTYIWGGILRLSLLCYHYGGIQFVLGIGIGIAAIFFAGFFKKIAIIAIILFLIGAIGIGIVASNVSTQDFKDGTWTSKLNITKDKYQQTSENIAGQIWQKVGS
jgi:hypothetical protein